MISFFSTNSFTLINDDNSKKVEEITKLKSEKLKVLNLSFSDINGETLYSYNISSLLVGFPNLEVKKKNFIKFFFF